MMASSHMKITPLQQITPLSPPLLSQSCQADANSIPPWPHSPPPIPLPSLCGLLRVGKPQLRIRSTAGWCQLRITNGRAAGLISVLADQKKESGYVLYLDVISTRDIWRCTAVSSPLLIFQKRQKLSCFQGQGRHNHPLRRILLYRILRGLRGWGVRVRPKMWRGGERKTLCPENGSFRMQSVSQRSPRVTNHLSYLHLSHLQSVHISIFRFRTLSMDIASHHMYFNTNTTLYWYTHYWWFVAKQPMSKATGQRMNMISLKRKVGVQGSKPPEVRLVAHFVCYKPNTRVMFTSFLSRKHLIYIPPSPSES